MRHLKDLDSNCYIIDIPTIYSWYDVIYATLLMHFIKKYEQLKNIEVSKAEMWLGKLFLIFGSHLIVFKVAICMHKLKY